MPTKTVYYIGHKDTNFIEKGLKSGGLPTPLDSIEEDCIVRQTNFEQEGYVYHQCPVYTHKRDRTFIVLSPIDLSISFNRGTREVISSNKDLVYYEEDGLNSPKAVFQIDIPKFIFWTDEKDVWLEFNDHPMTSYSNNFIAIGGWFNLSNWSKISDFAITIVDEEKPIIIKKGDPIFRLFFRSSNPNDGIILKQIQEPNKIFKITSKYKEKTIKGFKDPAYWKEKIFTDTTKERKCPVSFLFKRD